jgi:hypothetical protein
MATREPSFSVSYLAASTHVHGTLKESDGTAVVTVAHHTSGNVSPFKTVHERRLHSPLQSPSSPSYPRRSSSSTFASYRCARWWGKGVGRGGGKGSSHAPENLRLRLVAKIAVTVDARATCVAFAQQLLTCVRYLFPLWSVGFQPPDCDNKAMAIGRESFVIVAVSAVTEEHGVRDQPKFRHLQRSRSAPALLRLRGPSPLAGTPYVDSALRQKKNFVDERGEFGAWLADHHACRSPCRRPRVQPR